MAEYSLPGRIMDRIFGSDSIHDFRRRIEQFAVDSGKMNNWEDSAPALRKQIKRGHEEAMSSRIDHLATVISVIGPVIVLTPSLSPNTYFALLSLILIPITGARKGAVEIMIYEDSIGIRDKSRLKFMSAWNRGPMNSWKAYTMLAIGPCIALSPKGYKLAMSLLTESS